MTIITMYDNSILTLQNNNMIGFGHEDPMAGRRLVTEEANYRPLDNFGFEHDKKSVYSAYQDSLEY